LQWTSEFKKFYFSAGAVPTVFELPGHLVNPVHHRKPLAELNGCSMTVPKPTTSFPVEQSYEPVLEPSRKRPRNGSSLEENSNMTILPNKQRVCDGHNYCLPCPKVLKHRLNIMASALAKYKHKVKLLRQRNRRLPLSPAVPVSLLYIAILFPADHSQSKLAFQPMYCASA